MRLHLDHLATVKNYIHIGQGIILFLAWVLTIAIFTRNGHSDGRIAWYFGLCWLTIPILIYLTMVPLWSRARRFSNVYAFATVDAISIFLWLTAWAAVASYVASGKGKGKNQKQKGCDNFKYGSPGRCKLSEAVIILGLLIMVAFVATSYISFRSVMHYKRTGMMPAAVGEVSDFSAQTQDAFSSHIPNDELEEGRNSDARQGRYGFRKQSFDEEYAPVYQHDHDDPTQSHPTQPDGPLTQGGYRLHDYDTSYSGAGGR